MNLIYTYTYIHVYIYFFLIQKKYLKINELKASYNYVTLINKSKVFSTYKHFIILFIYK
jgi:hypothetical protein